MAAAKHTKKHSPATPATPPTPETPEATVAGAACPVIGIGASAGGLEAFEAFFRACPVDTGMAFVLVPHLDPGHESLLTEILQRSTTMPVAQAADKTRVQPNHVYIIPPNREMDILGGVLHLTVPELARGHRMPIDGFFRSLAQDQRERSIGVILSGTATDGTLGLRAILGAGGVCMVQEPSTAKYDGMPQSAINAGYATHILPVENMPAMLRLVVDQAGFRLAVPAVLPERSQSGINKILLQLRASTGHDFSQYKKSTIGRRIQRRMAQHHIDDEAAYARFLKDNPAENKALFSELLINVTSFFRDPEVWVALKQTILPPLLENWPLGQVFRVWVAGCSTGEEAYTIAMVLHELQAELWARNERELPVQIYATDLDDDAIAVARAGRYPLNVAQDIAPERLRRYFTKEQGPPGFYKIKKDIRDMVVFAVQNAIKDPPFTRLDLLSCRNLMIYLEAELQSRLISTFHYALKPGGILLLSTSESIPSPSEAFPVLDRKWKFYQAHHRELQAQARRKTLGMLQAPLYPIVKAGDAVATSTPKTALIPLGGINPTGTNIAEISKQALLQAYAPASVTTDARGNILYIHGDTGRYLRPAPGPVNNNVVEMAREGLQLVLRSTILQAVTSVETTFGEQVAVKTNGGFSQVQFTVQRLANQVAGAHVLLISFRDVATPASVTDNTVPRPAPTPAELSRNQELELKLAYANETLNNTLEEHQAFNEELKSTNEELQSTNEELQSSNEELETSKEELQSLNEETITVNAELNARIEQLTGVQNDLKNLMDSIGTGTLFLDHQLVIRRYTPTSTKIYRLIPTDVGRPLSDITSSLSAELHSNLLADLQTVLDTLVPIEREVQTLDGAWYLARIQPYRTLDNVIEGVVLTFTEVTEFKRASQAAQLATGKLAANQQAASLMARALAEGIVNTVTEPLIVLDGSLQVVSASHAFFEEFKLVPQQSVGQKVYAMGEGQWDIPALRELLELSLSKNPICDGVVLEHHFKALGKKRMVLNARRIDATPGQAAFILLVLVSVQAPDTP